MITNPTQITVMDNRAMIAVTVTGQNSDNVGGTVTAKLDNVTKGTGTTDSNGQCDIFVDSPGTYTVTYVKGTVETVATIEVTYSGYTYEVELKIKYSKVWAVDIAIDTSDPDTRCTYPQTITVNGETVSNLAYGKTPMAGSSGGTFTAGDWGSEEIVTSIKPVSSNGGSTPTFSDANKNASTWTTGTEYFTEFPFYWLSITNDGTKIRIIFSGEDAQPDSTFQCYAHCKACDSYSNSQIESAVSSASRDTIMSSNNNSYFANAFYIGCFGGNITSSNLYSKCSNTYTVSTRYAYYWQYANARGGEYDCMSFQQWTYLQALFILLFKSTNSQDTHSNGLTKVDSTSVSSIDTNAPLSTDTYGMAGKIGVAERMSFFWIHDLWGNHYQFIGGAWNRAGSSNKLYYWLPRQANSRAFNNGWTAATTQASQANMGTDTGLTYSSSFNFIVGVAGTNTGGFAPTNTSGGSATTYWCDYGLVSVHSSRALFSFVGGYNYASAGQAGLFFHRDDYNFSTNFGSDYGARLSYRGGHSTGSVSWGTVIT